MLIMKLQILLATFIAEIKTKNYFRPGYWPGITPPMVWVDGLYRDDSQKDNIDTFYDRIVGISQLAPDQTHRHTVTGVFITDQLILTTYNAHSTLALQKTTLNRITISKMYARMFYSNGTLFSYLTTISVYKKEVRCARQVIPVNQFVDPIPSHMVHGRHVPRHDLMVMRINAPVTFKDPAPNPSYSLQNYKEGTYNRTQDVYYLYSGLIRTELARPGDDIVEDDLKFASLGHLSDPHIYEPRYLEKEEIHPDDRVVTNCDEWFPRQWGHFICLINSNNYPGIASGGMLFSDGKLFGVGCFALFKKNDGVLVFTDVRPYWHLLYRTCTYSDQQLIIPKHDL